MRPTFSISEARRIAMTAQGFNGLSRDGAVNARCLHRAIAQLRLLQIDSVNVLVRAHYMPLFSRLGLYDRPMLDALIVEKPRRYFEYWGHEASVLQVDCHPLLRWRMANAYQGKGIWRQLEVYAGAKRGEAEALLERIRMEGPLAASDIAGSRATKGMWVWSDSKHALEWLFWSGLVSASHRRGSFERVYDLADRVLPRSVLDMPTPDETDARRMLLAQAARALGIATGGDLRDYFRMGTAHAKLPMQQLVEEGTIIPVTVQGWQQQAYLYKHAVAGRKTMGAALLSPFDPLVWYRPRTERLFHFRYRLEIYTPAHRREYGYYVLPFLLDGALVARVDLKADRINGKLLVQRIHCEPGAPRDTMERLGLELQLMAEWLDLAGVAFAAGPQPSVHLQDVV